MTNVDRILNLLATCPGLDDDEVSRVSGVTPRQQVNVICRRLADRGLLVRKPGASGKIGNFPTSGIPAQSPAKRGNPTCPNASRSERQKISMQRHLAADPSLRETLILIPCSGRKSHGGVAEDGCSPITEDLPATLARRLTDARRAVLGTAPLDDHQLMPAWQRYKGTLYVHARPALARFVDSGLHVLIISGGYGVIKACESIASYSAQLKLSHWQRGLLEEVLITYATHHRLRKMRAFVSQNTDYRRLLTRVPWQHSSVTDAILLTPEAVRGAMVKAPRAQGEAIAAFLIGKLHDDWQSSDGLRLNVSRVR